MTQWQDIVGKMVLEVTCADNAWFLNALSSRGIPILHIEYCNDLLLRIVIAKKNYNDLLLITEKHGASVKIIRMSGLYWLGKSIAGRPVILLLFCVLFLFTIYLPSRVLFVFVEGNVAVSTNQILEAAEECGLRFGASRRNVRSEILKNELLQKVPQLQWAGVNTAGCTAVISVREKTITQDANPESNQVCSIVAIRDGVIQSCTVYRGNPLCAVGQAVKAGQILVSGYLDCGLLVKATRADAEIRAMTSRYLEVVTPQCSLTRGQLKREKIVYSLQIGKKLIKLSKDSGNLDTTCGKIYEEKYICLPGGFRFPVAIIKETQLFYSEGGQATVLFNAGDWLDGYARSYLQKTMVAGEIISADTMLSSDNGIYSLSGRFTCTEIIGQAKYEQTMLRND